MRARRRSASAADRCRACTGLPCRSSRIRPPTVATSVPATCWRWGGFPPTGGLGARRGTRSPPSAGAFRNASTELMRYSVAVLPGDGIGKEVVPEGVRVLDAAARLFGLISIGAGLTGAARPITQRARCRCRFQPVLRYSFRPWARVRRHNCGHALSQPQPGAASPLPIRAGPWLRTGYRRPKNC